MKALTPLLGLLVAFAVQAETWRFAVIGDTPYSDYERRELPIMLEKIAEQHAAFIVHAGDITASNAKCSDQLFFDRFALFNASAIPFIYVPGDNEWTDCKRLAAGHFSERERLDRLREIFFSEPFSVGKTRIPVERQSAMFPEHLRWRLGNVLFVSLNVPGPNNNYGMGQESSREFLARNPFVIDWLKQGFASARRERSRGIVIVMQGNPGFKHFSAGLAHSGFRKLLEVLRSETLGYTGQVLLVHGDTHWQRIDHPLRHPETKERLTNFTRLETFGYPLIGWVSVIIDSERSSLFYFDVRNVFQGYPARKLK